jgi:hypothetical protein
MDIIGANIIRPPLEIKGRWRKQDFNATVQKDGTILFDGKIDRSPSIAAGMARNIASRPPPDKRAYWQTNGWTFWKYHDSKTGKLEAIDNLRRLCTKAKL